jgi:hypothetical protein
MAKKAFDKVLNYYFSDNYIDLDDIYGNPTRVEEAWVFIIRTDREGVPENHQFRVKCWWGYIPIVNEILIAIVNFLWQYSFFWLAVEMLVDVFSHPCSMSMLDDI